MITGEMKSKIDRIWDAMWSGGVSNPLSVIERLDELHTLKESKANRTGKPVEDPVFGPSSWPSIGAEGGQALAVPENDD